MNLPLLAAALAEAMGVGQLIDLPTARIRHPKRTGWTNASYRRAATKAKNQARHRRACRGA
jgi:hypothetical protein